MLATESKKKAYRDDVAWLSRGPCKETRFDGSGSLLFRGGFLECSPGTLMMTK
jgi:hypothetical protein